MRQMYPMLKIPNEAFVIRSLETAFSTSCAECSTASKFEALSVLEFSLEGRVSDRFCRLQF